MLTSPIALSLGARGSSFRNVLTNIIKLLGKFIVDRHKDDHDCPGVAVVAIAACVLRRYQPLRPPAMSRAPVNYFVRLIPVIRCVGLSEPYLPVEEEDGCAMDATKGRRAPGRHHRAMA